MSLTCSRIQSRGRLLHLQRSRELVHLRLQRGELRLTMDVEHTAFNCPFTVTEAGFCRAYLQPGDSGSFQITRRSAGASAVTGS